ncbi:MAG: DUF3137 domain-containing protein [Hyphomonas sp.]|uniref:DUF3137 domain-containing protein n=1 Tax=Hyphomonas sp. TaxID=87 RepID=UPI0017C873CF|nr:DUF3137 domain-containing protein [Hyphomonas sp.]MBU3920007.1 DUF3137 domain-containing protein [Alphaproteobacteria bacterium]MBA3070158.1 DUF3137 domain-containing protein [Hyphomonas sp.]MBU4060266.1 DUF3137 domain-containing protein [Alphaproteobacteria bacterium]MBU4162934.1 DUF3137 domain-containing protein [Alphaproteobacteria bacterium]MBU4569346.1 DUF3137 domain-containing protein [Alphaproteobacteria bacterium]
MSERDKASAPGTSPSLGDLPPEFADFGRLYDEEIRPSLVARELERIAAAERAIQTRWAGGAIILVGAGVGLALLKMPAVAIIVAIIGFGVIGWGNMGIMRLAGEAKSLIVEPIASKLNLYFTAVPGDCESIFRHKEVGVVPGWDRSKYEDLLTGRRGMVDFELFEAHLEERRTTTDSKGRTQTTWVTVFKGQCLRFDFHKNFYGRTLITRDAGFFNRFGGGKGMQRAALEDPTFEKIFEVYTTDQVESRYLLTPDLMQKLVDLEGVFRGGKLKAAFDGGEMFITVQGGNLFEPGSMFKPLDSADRVHELLKDFAAVFHLIDAVTAGRSRLPPPS